ncbi:MAG TPA: PAS domain S-box protein, partial [Terriglobales bacterium]|nr:PAS domain S-box protein [Terriglobales bacterium]
MVEERRASKRRGRSKGKRVAKMLKSLDPYRLLYENSMDGLLLTAPDGRIFAANPEACRMLQRSEEEIRQIGRSGVVDLNDPKLPAALVERARTGRFRGELNLKRKDGTTFPAEISTNVFKARDGHEITSMIIHDITGRKHAEQTFKTLFNSVADALFIQEIGGGFVEINRVACERLGYTREELLRMGPKEIDSSESAAMI